MKKKQENKRKTGWRNEIVKVKHNHFKPINTHWKKQTKIHTLFDSNVIMIQYKIVFLTFEMENFYFPFHIVWLLKLGYTQSQCTHIKSRSNFFFIQDVIWGRKCGLMENEKLSIKIRNLILYRISDQ